MVRLYPACETGRLGGARALMYAMVVTGAMIDARPEVLARTEV